MKKRKWSLYVVVERIDGTIMKQSVGKVYEDASDEEISRLVRAYKKLLGDSYFIIDWYLDR